MMTSLRTFAEGNVFLASCPCRPPDPESYLIPTVLITGYAYAGGVETLEGTDGQAVKGVCVMAPAITCAQSYR